MYWKNYFLLCRFSGALEKIIFYLTLYIILDIIKLYNILRGDNMENKKLKLIIRGKNKGEYQRDILSFLAVSNHEAFICSEGVGIEHLTIEQVQKALGYIYMNYPELAVTIKHKI